MKNNGMGADLKYKIVNVQLTNQLRCMVFCLSFYLRDLLIGNRTAIVTCYEVFYYVFR